MPSSVATGHRPPCAAHAVAAAVAILLVLNACPAVAQTQVRKITAAKTESAPTIDGDITDAVWAAAVPSSEFLQRDPTEGAPASEQTIVRILYDVRGVYFAILCHDSDPARIVATERGRDRDLSKDDYISIILDTFHDHRNAFQFTTNPLAARYDARITEEGRNIDPNWDDKWNVAARTTADGWSVEIEIPFTTLRTAGGQDQVWGIDFERIIRRKNEQTYWQNYSRNLVFSDVSQAGHLTGLAEVPDGLTVRFKPYVLGGLKQTTVGLDKTSNASTLGLDGKWRAAPSLTLDFTVNPDFAQSEVDEQIVNLTRFPQFFPERREFFRENAGVFEFGTSLGIRASGGRELIGFFSRRIGLAANGEEVPIAGGVRLTGRVGRVEIGALNMQTSDFTSHVSSLTQAATNYSVVRVKADVLSRSNVGLILTNKQSDKSADTNRTYGVDGNFVFWQNLRLRGFSTKSYSANMHRTAGVDGGDRPDEWASRLHALWNSDFTLGEVEYLNIGSQYNPAIGFVPRQDMRRYAVGGGFKPRPKSGPLRQLVLRGRIEYIETQRGRTDDWVLHLPTVEFIFNSGEELVLDFHQTFERLPADFAIVSGIAVPAGTYRGHDFRLQYTTSPSRRLRGAPVLQWSHYSDYRGGERDAVQLQPQIRLTSHLSASVGYQLDDVRGLAITATSLRDSFTSHVVNGRLDYSPTNNLLTTTMFQYNSVDRVQLIQFRLNRILRLSDNFYLTFNQTRRLGDGRVDRSVVAKMSHSLDF